MVFIIKKIIEHKTDTCVLIWLLKEDKRVKDLAEDIFYSQGDYAISVESIKEFLYLIQSGKIKTDITFNKLINDINARGISICEYGKDTLKELSELPFFKTHTDPSDRVISFYHKENYRTQNLLLGCSQINY